jgi:hypothetical protein
LIGSRIKSRNILLGKIERGPGGYLEEEDEDGVAE